MPFAGKTGSEQDLRTPGMQQNPRLGGGQFGGIEGLGGFGGGGGLGYNAPGGSWTTNWRTGEAQEPPAWTQQWSGGVTPQQNQNPRTWPSGGGGENSQLTWGGRHGDEALGGLSSQVSQNLQDPANFQAYPGRFLPQSNPGQWGAVDALYRASQSFPGQEMLSGITGTANQLSNFQGGVDTSRLGGAADQFSNWRSNVDLSGLGQASDALAGFNSGLDTSDLRGTAGDLRNLGQGFASGTHQLARPQVDYANDLLSGKYLDLQQNQALQDYLGLITTRSNEAFNQSVLPGIADASLRSGSQNNSRRGVATEQAGARHQDRLTQNLAAPTLQAYQFERGQQSLAPGILQGVAGLGGQALGQAGGLYGQAGQLELGASAQRLGALQGAAQSQANLAQFGFQGQGQELGALSAATSALVNQGQLDLQGNQLNLNALSNAGNQYAQAGQLAPSLWFGGAQAQGQAGQQAYALDQIETQNQLAQWQEQQNAPWRPLGQAAGILGGAGGGGQMYPQQPKPNPWIQGAQGAAGAYGLFNSVFPDWQSWF